MGNNQVVKTNKSLAAYYSAGFMSTQLSWYMINTYLMLFYTDVVGLTAGAISIIMLVARVWDAAVDPVIGMTMDRTTTRWGRFRPYIAIAAPFLAIFNILTFTVFPLQGNAKVIVCLVTYLIAGMAFSGVSVAINGLINRLSRDSQEKMNIVAISQMASSVIQVALSAFAMPMILFFSKDAKANETGYFWTTVVLSLISLPLYWICVTKCKEVVTDTVEEAKHQEKKPILKSLKVLFQNKMVLITIIMVFCGAMAIIARMSLLAYYIIYVVGSFTLVAPVFTAITLFQLIGNAFLPWGTKTFGKRNYAMALMVLNIICFVVLFFVPTSNTIFLIGISAVIGFCASSGAISYGMLCDSIDYGEYMYHVREEGLTSSFMSFSVKLAQAITGSVSVLLLAATGYVANAQQSPQALTGINMITNLIPAAILFISIIPMFWYKLDNKKMAEIATELDKRHAEKNASVMSESETAVQA